MNVTAPGSDPVAGAPTQAPARNRDELGKDQFLQLLVTQLRYQDPLNPSDPREFAAQLAQFSTLEQLVNIGTQLQNMGSADQSLVELINANSALGLLGKTILAVSDQVVVTEGGDGEVTLDVGASGGTATLRLLDESGQEVESRNLGELDAGRHVIAIDDARPGTHRYVVEVKDADGKAVDVITYTTARVAGIEYTANGPMLICGDLTIPLGAVVKVNQQQ